ncbi:MAG: polyprenyl synthetase family protein [Candidatus Omnitrophica bacterium]|nr:polyprenyl synthetase family protein [Candidatus Omnitrophota bacterium]
MFLKIKNKIEKELKNYIRDIEKSYSLRKISPLLFNHIEDFTLRRGKRIRPVLFIVGFRGFSNKIPPGLYKSAISCELLHDFMLIHDDVIDKSETRRGKPSMHAMLNAYLSSKKRAKFNGEDLSIVVGDVIFALSLHTFLSIKQNYREKERALRILLDAAMYTGSGEFIELLSGIKSVGEINKKDIYKIYDLKTAYYTFSAPLMMGAVLAKAEKKEIDKLFKYGIYLGRAFQIKDDILDMFAEEDQIGKSTLTDLKEAKKTIPIWYAYKNSDNKDRKFIEKILSKDNANKNDLKKIREITVNTGALNCSKTEISFFLNKAKEAISSSRMKIQYKNLLKGYCEQILSL